MFDPNLVLFRPVALLVGETVPVTTLKSGHNSQSHPRWQQRLVPAAADGRELGPRRMTPLEVAEGWLGRSIIFFSVAPEKRTSEAQRVWLQGGRVALTQEQTGRESPGS